MKVLLVEDEVALARTVKDGLVEEGFVVDVVGDGVTGSGPPSRLVTT